MQSASKTKIYYPALDGLRGLAILMVVLVHNFGFLHYFFFGWLGVDLFFVLSGFLITSILLSEAGTQKFLKNFYMRRMLRIFPIYFLTIAFCLLLMPIITSSLPMIYYKQHLLWFVLFAQNWLYIFNPPQGNSILLHFWSLAVEEQFYLFWPFIILLIRSERKLLWFVLSLLAFVMLLRYFLWHLHIADLGYDSFYTFTRVDGICIGSAIAILWRIKPSFLKNYTSIIVLSLAAGNFVMYFLNKNATTRLPYLAFIGYTTFGVMFGLLLNEVITGSSKIIEALFNNKIMIFFGRISYGLYVYHWPVYLILSPVLKNYFATYTSNQNIALLCSSLLCTLLAIIVSYFSYRYFERYFLSLKTRFS